MSIDYIDVSINLEYSSTRVLKYLSTREYSSTRVLEYPSNGVHNDLSILLAGAILYNTITNPKNGLRSEPSLTLSGPLNQPRDRPRPAVPFSKLHHGHGHTTVLLYGIMNDIVIPITIESPIDTVQDIEY